MIISVEKKQIRRAIIAFIVMLLLGLLVKINFFFPIKVDEAIYNFFDKVQTPLGDVIMSISTFLGEPTIDIIYAVVLSVILVIARLKIPAMWVIATVLSGDVVGYILKHLFARARPSGHLLTDSGFSFPSGHSLGITMIIMILLILVIPNINSSRTRMWLTWVLWTFGALTLMSRIYLKAHYFSDILSGALLAYAWVILTAWCYPLVANYLKQKIPFFKNEEI